MKDIMFIGNGRCYHTMDFYRNVQMANPNSKILFATDLKDSEGHTVLIKEGDSIIDLYNIDHLLLKRQTKFGNIWRNFIKLLFFPVQVRYLKSLHSAYPGHIYHAHTMYYMFLCWVAEIKFIGTPQGSEILVRPDRSRLYRYFAIKSLKAANYVTVDSVNMKNKIKELCEVDAIVVQYGIDINAINKSQGTREHAGIVSIRGMYPLYRIVDICRARDLSKQKPPLSFIYPSWDERYKEVVASYFNVSDSDLGRVNRSELYNILSSTLLAVSIPESDSSPRSVYEAIFCGCCVAVTYNIWIDALPSCMKERLIIVDLEEALWLEKAIEKAVVVTSNPYVPSEPAINMFDQEKSIKLFSESYYQ